MFSAAWKMLKETVLAFIDDEALTRGAAIAFYTEHLGFALETDASPAFASVVRGPLRLLLSGSRSSGARPMR